MVFLGAVEAGLTGIVLLAVVVSLLGTYRLVIFAAQMYMVRPEKQIDAGGAIAKPMQPAGRIGLWISAIIVFVLGVYPAPLLFSSDLAVWQLILLLERAG